MAGIGTSANQQGARFQGHGLAIGIGAASCLFFLLALEGACYWLNQSRFADTFATTSYPPPSAQPKPEAGRKFALKTSYDSLPTVASPMTPAAPNRPDLLDYSQKLQHGDLLGPGRFVPNASVRSVVRVRSTGQPLYDVIYHTDPFGRRVVPRQEAGARDRHLLFLGCSYTLGEGVSDEESFPAVVAAHAPRFRVYNLGAPGSSPSEFLLRNQENRLWNGVPERAGAAVYVYIDDHVNRVFGSMSIRAAWKGELPYAFEDRPGHFSVAGTFKAQRPLTTALFQFLWGLQTTKFFHLNFPLRLGEEHFATFAGMIGQIKNEYLARFPGQKFYVAFFPAPASGLAPFLIPELEKLGIEYLDYSGFAPQNHSPKPLTIPMDGHPSAELYRLWGQVLAADLNRL